MLNRRQAPGAARSLRMNSPPVIARGARHMKQSRLQKIIYGQHSKIKTKDISHENIIHMDR